MKDLIPLSAKSSPHMRWAPPVDFSFLSESPLLPVQAGELGRVASSLPLALCKDAGQSSGWSIVAVCGQTVDLNVMVGPDGSWNAKTIPDSVRYLPLTLMDLGGGKALPALDRRYVKRVLKLGNEGVPLFEEDGQLHEAARKRVEFLQQHHGQIQRTQKILAALDKAGLIAPWPESVIKSAGITIEGLLTIDEKALYALDDDTFLALRKGGALAVAYACLLSLYQVRNLVGKQSVAKPDSTTAVQTTGDLDLEFMNDSETIKFGPLT